MHQDDGTIGVFIVREAVERTLALVVVYVLVFIFLSATRDTYKGLQRTEGYDYIGH